MSEPSLPLTARGRSGDTRSRLAAGSGWRKPQDPTHCSRQVWGRVHSLLEAGLNPNPAELPDMRREGGRTGQTTTDDSTSDMNPKPLPINTSPDRRPSRPSPAGGVISSCQGLCVMGLGPPGKAMTEVVAAPAPGSLNNTNSIMGAGDGFGCPSPAKAQAPVGKGLEGFSATYIGKQRMVRGIG